MIPRGFTRALDEAFDQIARDLGIDPEKAAEVLSRQLYHGGPIQAKLEELAATAGVTVDELGGYLETRGDPELNRRRHEAYDRVCKLAREWACPPGEPRTAGNFELLAMNSARVVVGLMTIGELGFDCDVFELAAAVGDTEPNVARVLGVAQEFFDALKPDEQREGDPDLADYMQGWFNCGFARLEVGHKYAAALCCTDCPADIEVRAPWPAWSLVVPPGLLGDERTPARLWVLGTEWVASVWQNGVVDLITDSSRGTKKLSTWAQMVQNLIRGACLSLADPEQHRKHAGAGRRGKGNHRHGPPDLSQARFLLAPPVSVDVRKHVLEALAEGKAGHVPRVQFLVRGHWRQQAHGAGRAMRKTIWIEPHWKGPEAGKVLLRPHKLGAE